MHCNETRSDPVAELRSVIVKACRLARDNAERERAAVVVKTWLPAQMRMSSVLKGELDLDRLALRRLHLYGVSNRLRKPAQRAESTKRFVADLMQPLSDGRLRPIIDRSFALTEIAEAQAYLEADKHVGKVVMRV